jgi:hypothetical protein
MDPRPSPQGQPVSTKTKPDDFAWHEAMDRTSLLLSTFNTFVCEHPVMEDYELSLLAGAASNALFRLYQATAEKAPHMKATE